MSEQRSHAFKHAVIHQQLNAVHAGDGSIKDPFAQQHIQTQSSFSPWTKKLLLAAGAVIILHYAVWFVADHLPTQPLPEKKPEPVVIEIIKPKEEPPKIIEPKPEPVKIPPVTQQPKIPPVVEKPQPVKKVVEQAKPVQKTVTQPKPVEQPKVIEQPVQHVESQNAVPVPTPQPVEKVTPAPVETPKQDNLPVTEAKGYAGYLSNPAPEYPEIALDRGWEGSVILRVKVAANGSPQSVSVKTGSGKKLLDDAAVRTVKRWKFSPALRGSTPVEGWVDVPIHFKLPN